MARNRNQTVTTTTVTRDAVDILVNKLNEIEGITFERGAWESEAPDDCGAVEMSGQYNSLWADDKQQEQTFTVAVHLYCKDGGNQWISKIQEKLAEAVDWYTMPTHEYIYEIEKNHWTWNAFIIAPLQWEEVVTNGTVGS